MLRDSDKELHYNIDMEYRKAQPRTWWCKEEHLNKIKEMADLILDGEESLLEEYNALVEELVKKTNGQAPAFRSDPVMYKELCDNWGKEPSLMSGYSCGKRPLNYTEMTRFMRGYWR